MVGLSLSAVTCSPGAGLLPLLTFETQKESPRGHFGSDLSGYGGGITNRIMVTGWAGYLWPRCARADQNRKDLSLPRDSSQPGSNGRYRRHAWICRRSIGRTPGRHAAAPL